MPAKKTPTQEFISMVRRGVDDARGMREEREKRWNACLKQLYGDVTATSPTGETCDAVNTSQMKGDQMATLAALTVCSQRPYVLVKTALGEPLDIRTEVVDQQLSAAKLEQTMLEAANLAWATDNAIVRIEPPAPEDKIPVVKLTVIDPRTFYCWPTFADDPDQWDGSLHQIQRTKGAIDALSAKGVYLKTPMVGDGDPERIDAGANPSRPASELAPDEKVTLLTGVVRWPGTDKWYDVTVSTDGGTIYRFEEYPYSLNPYRKGRFKSPKTGDGAYSSTSKGNDIQGVSQIIDTVVATTIEGMAFAAAPAVFEDGMGDETPVIRPGQRIRVEDATKVQPVPGTGDARASAQFLPLLMNYTDMKVQSSQMGAGGQQAGVNTATEADLIAQGAQHGMNAVVMTFSDLLEGIAAVTDDILIRDTEKRWTEMGFADDAGLLQSYMAEAQLGAQFQASTTSMGGTPQARLSALQQFAMTMVQIAPQMFKPQEFAQKYAQLLKHQGVPDAEDLVGDPVDGAFQTLVEHGAQQYGIDPGVLAGNLQAATALAKNGVAIPAPGGMGAVPPQPGMGVPDPRMQPAGGQGGSTIPYPGQPA